MTDRAPEDQKGKDIDFKTVSPDNSRAVKNGWSQCRIRNIKCLNR